MTNNVINFDPTDWDSMLEYMRNADKYDQPYVGENEQGETVFISVNRDNITVVTNQTNGWVRKNIYWEDFTVEELFDGKWE